MTRRRSTNRCHGLRVRIGMTQLGPIYGHSGYFPGFNSSMGYFPDHALAVAVQWNSDGVPPASLQEQLISAAQAILGEAGRR